MNKLKIHQIQKIELRLGCPVCIHDNHPCIIKMLVLTFKTRRSANALKPFREMNRLVEYPCKYRKEDEMINFTM